MIRDYSQFLPSSGRVKPVVTKPSKLPSLGWQAFFAQQCDLDAQVNTPPVRVIEVHRNGLHVLGDGIDQLLPPGPEATVGDWLLLDREHPAGSAPLRRKSLFQRRAPGRERKRQLIAANVDTAFITSSCNKDFNIARLERYVALAFEAEVTPVIVLTKADLCPDSAPYQQAALAISSRVIVVTLNALGAEPQERLGDWCRPGQTVAFLGSSGVGKSTLTNALTGTQNVETSGIREDDAKGRHTTTRRQLHFLANGCAVLDTPGMRELQLTDVESGIADLFEDIASLATQCRFTDCRHDSEPGCAIQAAVKTSEITPERLARWHKLVAEERFNASTLAERKSDDKALQKRIRAIQKHKRK
ncbi:ribosome small subunit-dependent GTPase A [Pseudophaeobacter sp.]|uniref:ribosome small subunit-dependent GTPase A n=1 Tax=Pseudophaeobacter sp. TaxID=1971739 RepID=UPI003297ED43